MRNMLVIVLAVGSLHMGHAQPATTAAPVPPGTAVEIELLENLSSQTMLSGQTVKFKTVRSVEVNGITMIPAGRLVAGEAKAVRASGAFQKNGSFDLILRPVRLDDGSFVHLDFYRPKLRSATKEKTEAAIVSVPVLLYYFPLIPVAAIASARSGKPYEIRSGERYLVYVIAGEQPAVEDTPGSAQPKAATEPQPAQPSRE